MARRRFSNTARSMRGRKFSPFVAPTRPPSGSYDPILDQQYAAAGRGLQDMTQDTARSQGRAEDDYSIAQNRVNQTRGYRLSDLLRAGGEENQDYGIAGQGLTRRYGILADSQRQAANAAGVLQGGFAAQSAAKRAGNQQIEQSALDLAHTRRLDSLKTDWQRTQTAGDEQLGDLGLSFQRGNEDRNTALTRGQREYGMFGADTDQSRWYAARASGYVPPDKPAGEGHRGNVTYRRVQGGAVLPSGRFLSSSALRRYLARRGV